MWWQSSHEKSCHQIGIIPSNCRTNRLIQMSNHYYSDRLSLSLMIRHFRQQIEFRHHFAEHFAHISINYLRFDWRCNCVLYTIWRLPFAVLSARTWTVFWCTHHHVSTTKARPTTQELVPMKINATILVTSYEEESKPSRDIANREVEVRQTHIHLQY